MASGAQHPRSWATEEYYKIPSSLSPYLSRQTSGRGTQPPQLPPQQQQYSADFLFKQRLESAKAALLCGGVGAASRLIAVGAGAVAPAFLVDILALPESDASALLLGIASGFAQGALFGLTYR